MERIEFSEYGKPVCSFIKQSASAPKCPQAVIPILTVENSNGVKGLAGCFVHVDNINTTFYIDDKGRLTITWAGPVEAENYDFEANALGLRSQMVYDFANNRAAYYNKSGAYRVISLTEE